MKLHDKLYRNQDRINDLHISFRISEHVIEIYDPKSIVLTKAFVVKGLHSFLVSGFSRISLTQPGPPNKHDRVAAWAQTLHKYIIQRLMTLSRPDVGLLGRRDKDTRSLQTLALKSARRT